MRVVSATVADLATRPPAKGWKATNGAPPAAPTSGMHSVLDTPSDKPSLGTHIDGPSKGPLRFRTRLSVRLNRKDTRSAFSPELRPSGRICELGNSPATSPPRL